MYSIEWINSEDLNESFKCEYAVMFWLMNDRVLCTVVVTNIYAFKREYVDDSNKYCHIFRVWYISILQDYPGKY